MAIKYLNLTSLLPLYQAVKTNVIAISITDSLELIDGNVVTSNAPKLKTDLILFQNAKATVKKNIYSFTHNLELSQSLKKVIEVNLLQFITFNQYLNKPRLITHTLGLTQSVNVLKTTNIKHNLNLVSKGKYTLKRTKRITTALTLSQGVASFVIPKKSKAVNRIYIDPLIITEAKSFIITKNILSVTLRSPNFGNNSGSIHRRIQRESRGRSLIIASETGYSRKNYMQHHKVSFSYLKNDTVKQLLRIFSGSLGQIFSITDHEGRSWSAISLTPELEVVQEGRCNYSTSFEFEIVT